MNKLKRRDYHPAAGTAGGESSYEHGRGRKRRLERESHFQVKLRLSQFIKSSERGKSERERDMARL